MMKIIKRLFPCLSSPQSSPNQMQPIQVPPLRKKALLIGIQYVRTDTVASEIIQEKDEKAAAHIAPKRKNKKAPELRGPHRDVLDMEQLLISALYLAFPTAC